MHVKFEAVLNVEKLQFLTEKCLQAVRRSYNLEKQDEILTFSQCSKFMTLTFIGITTKHCEI